MHEKQTETITDTDEQVVSSPVKIQIIKGVSYALIAGAFFVGGVVVGTTGNNTTNAIVSHLPFASNSLDATPSSKASLNDFWEVWNILNEKFVETHASSTIPVTKDKVWGAIKGLTASYDDPYTVFMPPQKAKMFQQDIAGSFGGVGMEVGMKNGSLTVISSLKDTPAARANILSGDKIVAIDGRATDGMSVDEAVRLIRGPRGVAVTLTILRGTTQHVIKVVRATIQVPETDYGMYKNTDIYHIALYTFSANSATLFDKALVAFKKTGSHKLVIDLRGNPGGYLNAAVDIASHFLPKGNVVVTEDYAGKQPNIVHYSLGYNDVSPQTKIVVLINQGSASAAEILSGALQDHDRATLIGTRSFGKGSVQELVNVDGGSLKVTVAKWLTPSGRSISDGGLTPDIKINDTQAGIRAGKDAQKERAIRFFSKGK